MASDGKLPVEQQKKYSSAFDAVARVARSEGITRLWTGCQPTVIRACAFNTAQLATYAQFKEHLVDSGLPDRASTHLVAAFGSGFCATVISLPFDITKTRLQKTVVTEAGAKPVQLYTGMFDCIAKTARNEGPLALWKGFTRRSLEQDHTLP